LAISHLKKKGKSKSAKDYAIILFITYRVYHRRYSLSEIFFDYLQLTDLEGKMTIKSQKAVYANENGNHII
jgi:hypothetical protein